MEAAGAEVGRARYRFGKSDEQGAGRERADGEAGQTEHG